MLYVWNRGGQKIFCLKDPPTPGAGGAGFSKEQELIGNATDLGTVDWGNDFPILSNMFKAYNFSGSLKCPLNKNYMRRIKYWKWKWTTAINISWFNNIKLMGWNRIIH